ncbi:MAG: DUF2157 domain-containing protein [Bdellovibrionaceae bacterium]|jgi:uncharacterized membrane protein|nr:DUF2157 domain-containing protein [Pseudobdellovibrionaceae bacterium]
MKILESDLDKASQNGIITQVQVTQLWNFLSSQRPEDARMRGLHVTYYLGGILILASMSWFLTTAWNNGGAIMAISGVFALLYFLIGKSLWRKSNLQIPGGLLITAAVGLTPVFIYGFQKTTGLWPSGNPGSYANYHMWVKGSWLFMELGTILSAVIALRFFKFTFISFPLALTLWYMSMDLTPLIFGKHEWGWDERKMVSCIFGFLMLAGSYFIDRKYKKNDFAFWTYLYGMLAFWVGLTFMDSYSELSKFMYGLLNVGFVFLSVYFRRKVFIVFGSLGVMVYLTHLAESVFKGSYSFPIVLSLLGLLIVFLGVKYQQNHKRFELMIEKSLPSFLVKWRPVNRA